MVVKKDIHDAEINPIEFILHGRAKEIFYEHKFPHDLRLADVKVVVKSLTAEEKIITQKRAQAFLNASKVVVDAFGH